MQKYVCAIGGINLDIKGITDNLSHAADSHIGKIHTAPGGVARNVAENLSRLKIPVYLLGCIGTDGNGKIVSDKTNEAGVNTEHIMTSDKINTAVYLSVSDNEGNLISAVNDMKESLNMITVEYLKEKTKVITNSRIIFADTNLNKESLQYVITTANENKIPLYIDTVSGKKSSVIKDLQGKIDYLSPNLNEFNNIFGEFNIDRINWKLEDAAFQKFRFIILKRGEKAAVLLDIKKNKVKLIKPIELDVVEPNGAGDAFNAGFIYGLMNQYEEYDSTQLGICAAHFALKSIHSVSEKLTEESLLQLFKRKSQNEF